MREGEIERERKSRETGRRTVRQRERGTTTEIIRKVEKLRDIKSKRMEWRKTERVRDRKSERQKE